MAMAPFGPEVGSFAGIACVVSYRFSGHAGIYHAQRISHAVRPSEPDEAGLSAAQAIGQASAVSTERPQRGSAGQATRDLHPQSLSTRSITMALAELRCAMVVERAQCYVANSVNFPVRCEPVSELSGA